MKRLFVLTIAIVTTFGFIVCYPQTKKAEANEQDPKTEKVIAATARPSDSDLMAFKVYHHMMYNGDKTEVFTIPNEPKGVELFWSLTRYSALTRNTLPGKNDLFNAYNTKPDADGNITVTFSVEDPKDGTYWMPVNAGEPYYFVIRYYKPDVDKLPPKPCI